jgi:hypothetical protein
MNRLLAGVLLSTALLACEKDDEGQESLFRQCSVEWRGASSTTASAFNVQACWKDRCTSSLVVQAARSDGGSSAQRTDAGCVPTTPGGMPSHCDVVPITPGPGCAVGDIGSDFSVSACAQSSNAGTNFDIVLTATREGYPDNGDRFDLSIETRDGESLVDASATIAGDGAAADSKSCGGALLGLDGSPIE